MAITISHRGGLKYFLMVLIFGLLILTFYHSLNRKFNFDEFQVLYASASLERDKALYEDNVGRHFPFVNILFAIMFKVYGFKATALLLARIITFFVICATLFLVCQIGKMLKDIETGLAAVAFTLSSLVFTLKGIEIRHDVFSMFFLVAGVYFALESFHTRKHIHLVMSGLSLGFALASTQKAIIWIIGVALGIAYCLRFRNTNNWYRYLLLYFFLLFLPLFVSLSILLFMYDESVKAIVQITILRQLAYFFPGFSSGFPLEFPYGKLEMFLPLIYENGLLYLAAVIGMVYYLVRGFRGDALKIPIVFWGLFGVLFFALTKRPFYQSFLPTIPSLAILSSLFISECNETIHKRIQHRKEGSLFLFCAISLILIWPVYLFVAKTVSLKSIDKQMENVSFCVSHLTPGDKVLCFTKQQIYFDPVFDGLGKNLCGRSAFDMEQSCFENQMIKKQCKLVIYDYRTKLLSRKNNTSIAENYRYIGIGHILIPGFSIKPREKILKKVWIPGMYYTSSKKILIDGAHPSDDRTQLHNRTYAIHNLTSNPVTFSFVF